MNHVYHDVALLYEPRGLLPIVAGIVEPRRSIIMFVSGVVSTGRIFGPRPQTIETQSRRRNFLGGQLAAELWRAFSEGLAGLFIGTLLTNFLPVKDC